MLQAYGGALQGSGQASPYGASSTQGAGGSASGGSSDPIHAIGSALAGAFGGGLNQPAASSTATLQSQNGLGRKMA